MKEFEAMEEKLEKDHKEFKSKVKTMEEERNVEKQNYESALEELSRKVDKIEAVRWEGNIQYEREFEELTQKVETIVDWEDRANEKVAIEVLKMKVKAMQEEINTLQRAAKKPPAKKPPWTKRKASNDSSSSPNRLPYPKWNVMDTRLA